MPVRQVSREVLVEVPEPGDELTYEAADWPEAEAEEPEDEVVGRRNARNRKRLDLERAALQALPAHRTTDYEQTIL